MGRLDFKGVDGGVGGEGVGEVIIRAEWERGVMGTTWQCQKVQQISIIQSHESATLFHIIFNTRDKSHFILVRLSIN